MVVLDPPERGVHVADGLFEVLDENTTQTALLATFLIWKVGLKERTQTFDVNTTRVNKISTNRNMVFFDNSLAPGLVLATISARKTGKWTLNEAITESFLLLANGYS